MFLRVFEIPCFYVSDIKGIELKLVSLIVRFTVELERDVDVFYNYFKSGRGRLISPSVEDGPSDKSVGCL